MSKTPKRKRAANKDEELFERYCATFRFSANTRGYDPPMDPGDAIDQAMMHWPAFDNLYGIAPDISTIQDDASNDMIFAGLPARQTFTRNSCTDPMSRTPIAAGANVVNTTEFRIAAFPSCVHAL